MALSTIPTRALSEQGINFRNLIINGDMSIAQRGTSVSSITSGGYKTLDRFNIDINSAGTWTMSQSTTVPSGQGFATSLKMDCTTADASLSASDYLIVRTLLEGQNLQQLKFGTSSAESLTLSFWVRSNKTGTYAVWFYADVGNKSFSKTYTIDSADTWEKKTITINGDTASSFSNNNSIGLRINWYLAAGTTYTSGTLPTDWQTDSNGDRAVGQVNLADNTANEWYITGVQLEVGTSASDFEFLPYDVNLRRCQRYYYTHAEGTNKIIGAGIAYSSSQLNFFLNFPVSMRATPTLDYVTGTGYWRNLGSDGAGNGAIDDFNSFILDRPHINATGLYADGGAGVSVTGGQGSYVVINNASGKVSFDAEL